MKPLPATPFESGWWSFDLGNYRPCDSTYCLFPYEGLPPLPEPDPTLSWLTPLTMAMDDKMEIYRNPPSERGKLNALMTDAERLGLSLPEAFIRLMSSHELQDRIPSCTACTFSLEERMAPCPGSTDAYVVSFLWDQQACIAWCLYLTPRGEHCVLAMPGYVASLLYGETIFGEASDEELDTDAVASEICVCAPSFAMFIYRFWLENTVWYKLTGNDGTPLTDVERRYLDHYERQNTSDS